jgi:hypothetical protein
MMMKTVLRAVLAVAALSALALSGARKLEAQTMFGAEAMVGTDTEFGLGGRVHFDLAPSVPNLEIMGSFDYFFPDGPTYVGGGLNIGHIDRTATEDDTDVGINLGGGVRFLFENTIPFLEARVTIGGVEQLVIGGGVLFGRF